ncbi:hypothetical protein IFM89_005665 [Coptis chinensis]|uniref:EXPERA domain-containing protein n=1 Tax=Coptis chinensis TaxID=261450 RepID=A0A835GWI2_9MAGN|nr:hypothetical protein IFM89_005665 [Coptis chinensis]
MGVCKLVDAVLFIYFLFMAISTMLFHSDIFLPSHFFPDFLMEAKSWYLREYEDYLFIEKPHFLVGLVGVELLVQWPLSVANVYGIIAKKYWWVKDKIDNHVGKSVMRVLDSGVTLFTMNSIEEAIRLARMPPLRMNTGCITFQRWRSELNSIDVDDLKSNIKWIKFVGIPIHLKIHEVVTALAEVCGILKCIDDKSMYIDRTSVRVLVESVSINTLPRLISLLEKDRTFLIVEKEEAIFEVVNSTSRLEDELEVTSHSNGGSPYGQEYGANVRGSQNGTNFISNYSGGSTNGDGPLVNIRAAQSGTSLNTYPTDGPMCPVGNLNHVRSTQQGINHTSNLVQQDRSGTGETNTRVASLDQPHGSSPLVLAEAPNIPTSNSFDVFHFMCPEVEVGSTRENLRPWARNSEQMDNFNGPTKSNVVTRETTSEPIGSNRRKDFHRKVSSKSSCEHRRHKPLTWDCMGSQRHLHWWLFTKGKGRSRKR